MNASSFHRTSRGRRAHRGFTLIELMITVAIVAILARVAIPSYMEHIKRGKMVEAFNTLSSYSMTLGQWYQDNRSYTNACAAVTTGTMADVPATTTNFAYDCPIHTQLAYQVRATGQNSLAGFVFTIDNNGVRTSTAAASTGWPSNATCWVSSKSGTCY